MAWAIKYAKSILNKILYFIDLVNPEPTHEMKNICENNWENVTKALEMETNAIIWMLCWKNHIFLNEFYSIRWENTHFL